jgi:DNA-binding CsgD family transcriptional regulator
MVNAKAAAVSPLARVTGSTPLPLLVVDDDRRCLETNLAACRFFGVARHRLLGRPLDDLLTADMSDRLGNVWEAFRESGGHAGPFDVSIALADARTPRVDLSVTSGILPGRHLVILLPAGESASAEDYPEVPAAAELRRPSARELEVLEQLAGGATDGQIARRLNLSPATVQTHVRNAKAKLGARTRAQAVALALREGLIAVG